MPLVVKVGGMLVLTQVVFYLAIYWFLRTGWTPGRFLLWASPLYLFSTWGPLWAFQVANRAKMPLLPVQLGMFGAAVLAALAGLILIHRETPSLLGWVGVVLVAAGMMLSVVK